jgi:hypothetical protein
MHTINLQTLPPARRLAAALLCLLLGATAALAQTGRSTVRGTVRDQQGNVVTGANVTLVDVDKNASRTAVTNEEGGYVFAAIPPGSYRVEVESKGFKKVTVADVRALVDTPTDVDVQLEAGLETETVTVTSSIEAPLNTTDATIGTAFENRRIEALPLNARNVVGLLSLQTGVTRTGYVNGGRADQANVLLDGVDVNEQQRGLDVVTDEAFASVLRSTPDSLQEFRVITTNPNAEQGRSSGAQVSLVTKSGTNDFHGSLYEYHRNTVTSANDFFNNKAGVERPPLLRNIFGGSIGGPIKKDKIFFFGTYEGFREATATTVVREVPLATLGQGIVRYRTDSGASDPNCPAGTPAGVRCLNVAQINAAYNAANGVSPGVNPLALAALASAATRYPANDPGVGDGLNTSGFRFNASTPAKLNTYITRFDFQPTSRQTFFLRGNYQQDTVAHSVYGAPDCSSNGDNVQCFPDSPALTLWNHPWGVAAGHTWTISNNRVNRFTYGFTRAAFTDQGDSTSNLLSFRFVFRPLGFKRTLERTTPVHNFVEDFSWVKGTHTYQMGGNVRLITNNRNSFAASFDSAITNPSFYDASGDVILFDDNGDPIFSDVSSASETDLRDALTAVIGRFSQFAANLQYDASGQLLAAGSPSTRSFATQEYEVYLQDSWRWRPNLTFTYGVRWSTSTPVYEKNGVQVSPTVGLGDFFRRRVESAEMGVPLNELITLDKSGKANDRPGYYDQDWNNFAPSVAVAYSPDFGDNFFGRLIGRRGKSVIRAGYRLTYDRIGSQLAVNFDLNSSLGFSSARSIAANTFNVTDRLGPLFTGSNVNVRPLLLARGFDLPTSLSFPLTTPANEDQRIEQSLDDTITTPYNHSVNVSYGRELGKGLSFETAYVGRFARKLLATRDVMHLNNIRDPQSGMTWYEAANRLVDLRYAGAAITSVAPIPFFENMFPGLAGNFNVLGTTQALTATQAAYRRFALSSVGGRNSTDYTFAQLLWDDSANCTPQDANFCPGPARFNNTFFHPQYGALSVFSTIAESNYNSAQFSLRQRLRNDLVFDLNYTLSHSLDTASGLQSSTGYGTAFILNPLNPDQNYASSDFDVRHVVNANWLVGLPVGRGRWLGHDMNKWADGVLGGWQLTGIFRWNSGLPVLFGFFQSDRWATNWNAQSNGVRVRPVVASPGNFNGEPNLFADPTAALQSFRDARPGEAGDRNVIRGPGYISLDAGLSKSFRMPWEGHSIQFRWEVFNVTNTQRFDGNTLADQSLTQDPFVFKPEANPDFGRFTSTQTPLNETKAGRVMQFALRYQF